MNVVRACLPCRSAKVKCDRVHPVCGRCEQRGLSCSGLPADVGFIFRDENEASQRNSERARKRPRVDRVSTVPLDVIPSQANREQQVQTSMDVPDLDLQLQYSWLNENSLANVPGPLKRDLETRAVDRFFINWTLYPLNDGASTGYMHDLPMLYLSAPPGSVLWQAVRAVAFADMKHACVGDRNFSIMARQHYGATLSCIRAAAHEEQEIANDHVLAAILLIDNFESIYLARTEPLGPHRDAVKYILRAAGDEHLFSRPRFALWCVAHQRLQSRQILLREGPSPEQLSWISKLNIDRPDIHISADIMHMNVFSAAAKTLTQNIEDSGVESSDKIEKVRQLAQESQDLVLSVEKWTTELNSVWEPKTTNPQDTAQAHETSYSSNISIPQFPCSRVSGYQDIWFAYKLNCHCASQIVFRESLVDIIKFRAKLQNQELDMENMERIGAERLAVDRLSAAIIQSYPSLLGFTNNHSEEAHSHLQGRMAGRLFSIFPMWVIQRAQFTSDLHKRAATEVIEWINFCHGLG